MVSRDGLIAVYIMASRRHGTLYIGVTGHLWRRVCQHREGLIQGFTKDYGCKRLVWFQSYDEMTFAIRREKSMKRWPRDWKINLIERTNPHWEDLFPYKHGVIPRRIPIPVILGLVPRTHDLRAARCASAPLFPVILAPVARTHDLRVTDLGSGAAAAIPETQARMGPRHKGEDDDGGGDDDELGWRG